MHSLSRTALVGVLVAATCFGIASASASSSAAAQSVPAASSAGFAMQAPATPQTKPESVFVPVTPCRIVDTRKAVGPLSPGDTRNYYVGGTFGFAPQGGKLGGCGIPVGATAVAAVITAVTPTHGGYLKTYPSGTSAPDSSILNYPPNLTIGSGVTLPISTTTAQSLAIYNFGGPTQMILHVQGYYAQQIQALVGGGGVAQSGTSRVLSVSHAGTGSYYVTLDRPARECAPVVTTFKLYRYGSTGISSSLTPNVISVYLWTLDPTTHRETPTDYTFFLSVTC